MKKKQPFRKTEIVRDPMRTPGYRPVPKPTQKPKKK